MDLADLTRLRFARVNTFGSLIRKHRGHKTLLDTARHLHITVAKLSNIERGVGRPLSDEEIGQIAVFFEVDPAPLIEASITTLVLQRRNGKRDATARLLRAHWKLLTEEQLDAIGEIVGGY